VQEIKEPNKPRSGANLVCDKNSNDPCFSVSESYGQSRRGLSSSKKDIRCTYDLVIPVKGPSGKLAQHRGLENSKTEQHCELREMDLPRINR
jgi:hypothetical protein